ncbi:branched-chain amino acid ABC transporter permease [Agrobacterium sp. SHOUNA12C]|uniref:ABC transporter permease protein n=1 Tax=Rhizobium rhizogenes NBRC 13257 TaxID=1220581 RepID=A0AA87Q1A6_RHIRH|nr:MULTISPECIES: branched-chain amino acid ABC transporter permease [Rhizobium]MCJ9720652.1 branched-chain amino acid ABC transporter permease [Agrobacterium sp. BETTINA12B]MCJ9757286.1 branched-chain amino acid ABC transporter permease [Agrobacterium sp. SHOUNA12C]EJK79880.1 ABC-type branched-chain amino acid transport system, permease component [Rhizobium sp. AP16]NTF51354.1 branched-chain amino acid ABC transporter permease [Rhizobium rhizogenes]NTF57888.1 branched-chain amino acid ABC tran
MSVSNNVLTEAAATSSKSNLRILAVIAGLLLLFVAVPLGASDYWLSSIIIPTLVMGLAGISLNLLMGYAGLVSLGSAAFMSIGAFTAYNLILRAPFLPLPVVLLVSGLVAAAAGVVFGLPALRIKGFYLGASTLGAQFFFEWVFSNFTWFSNDSQSLTISAPRLAFLGRDLQSPAGRYLLAISVATALIGLAFLIVKSRLGREWMAIRDMDTAASVIGIRIARRKLQAYAISSFFLGVTGVLWGFAYLGTSDAHTFNLDKSFQVLFIVLIGGTATIFGNFLGAAFIVLTPILLDRIVLAANLSFLGDQGALTNLQRVIFGVIIILILIKEPDGLAALIRRATAAIGKWKRGAT